MLILTINPGSTSTKIGIFEAAGSALKETFVETIRHTSEELSAYPGLISQLDFRKKLIESAVTKAGLKMSDIEGFIGRGGLLRSIEGGCYAVNEQMVNDLRIGLQGTHASNLGGLLAKGLADTLGKKAYIADPVVVDELKDEARVSGHPLFKKKSIFHALNQKAIARKFCIDNNKDYFGINLIIAHMGGGVSVGAHEKGRVIEVNNALDGGGPFSPERSGTLPVRGLIDVCFSGEYTKDDVLKMVQPMGGFVAYFGVNDFKQITEMAETDDKVRLVLDACCYGIAKEIGSCAVALNGNVDAIILTGGMAYSKYLVNYIENRVKFIADVHKYPGEDELLALAAAVLRVLNGEEEAKVY